MQRPQTIASWLVLGATILLLRPAAAQRPEGSLMPSDLHVGFMRSLFSGVNETDAQAAFKVFATRMGEKRGYAISAHVHIFDDIGTMAASLTRQPLDMVVLASWEYLSLEPIDNLPVVFVAVEDQRAEEEFVVVVRADSEFRQLSDLAGRHVNVLRSSNANTVRHWFRTEILALGRGEPEQFLGRYELREHLSHAVLPVFFGKVDAAAVDHRGLDTMIDLNPQLGSALRVLLMSPSYIDTVICVRTSGWVASRMRSDLIDAIQNLKDDPAGRQIMTLFKFGGVKLFDESQLTTMRALRQRFLDLQRSGKRTAPAPGSRR